MTTEQSKALLNAEQPQPDLVLVLAMESAGRLKPDTLIAHLDMNDVTGPDCEVDVDPIDMGVLHCVEQQLADRLKEQDANITCLRVGSGVGGGVSSGVGSGVGGGVGSGVGSAVSSSPASMAA